MTVSTYFSLDVKLLTVVWDVLWRVNAASRDIIATLSDFQVFPQGQTKMYAWSVIKQTKFIKSQKDVFFDLHGSIISESMANAFSMIDAECNLVGTDCPIKLHS